MALDLDQIFRYVLDNPSINPALACWAIQRQNRLGWNFTLLWIGHLDIANWLNNIKTIPHHPSLYAFSMPAPEFAKYTNNFYYLPVRKETYCSVSPFTLRVLCGTKKELTKWP